MERSDKARADYGLRRMGNGELRALMDPMGTGAVGGQEEEEEEEEGGGLAKRVRCCGVFFFLVVMVLVLVSECVFFLLSSPGTRGSGPASSWRT